MNACFSLSAALFAAFCALPAHANPEEVVLDATLLPGWSTDQGTHIAALSLTLAPGWKTYWRSPGEAGIPPAFDWTGSENLQSVALHWPTPDVFHTSGMLSIGYHDGMLLPIEVQPVDASQPIVLRARVDIGVCKDICVPAMLDVSVTLTQPGVGDPAIKAALRDHPLSAQDAGVGRVSCQVDPIRNGLRVTATLTMPSTGPDETVVIEPGMADIWASDTVIMRAGNTLTAAADLVGPRGTTVALDRSAMVLTVLGDAHAVEIRGCPAE
ncbi:MAG: protein-disulfide reductase DsbD domain-containing protein [Paracoccaceae bacterium]